jgi:hypothetical protein
LDLLRNYTKAVEALGEYFDTGIYYNVIVLDDEEWTDYGSQHDSVGWELLKDEDDDLTDFNYGFEVYGTSRWESKDGKYTLFVGDDGCGNRDCYVFLNSLKIEEGD